MLDNISALNLHLITTVIVTQAVTNVFGISCYQCSTRHFTPTSGRLCAQFNQTPYFQVDCPFSTFCIKKIFNLPINEKNVAITVRDCASQKEMEQVERDGTMQWETRIVEGVYEEGCTWTDNSHKIKINSEQICYCEKPLCNGQAQKDTTSQSDIMGIILVYNAIKYVRSFQ